ncbi:MAG: crossover junction endodeoxyribonuclease RuvC [Phycisphaerales bacterium]|nr:crossover junction endodeoxyribonuclease RuvC [Phycisphaerales bacterium]
MRILGIDPGLRITGYGCVDCAPAAEPRVVEAGVIRVPANRPLAERLHQLHGDIEAVLEELAPALLAIESLYTDPRRATTGVRLGHARGVIMLAAAKRGIDVTEHPPAEVKKSLTGDGRADKRRMQLAIATRCRLEAPPDPPDVADALAVAICASQRLASQAALHVI